MSLPSITMNGSVEKSIDSFERSIEHRLDGSRRMLWQVFVVLVTNAAACLLVMGSTRVFEIVVQGRVDRVVFRYLESAFDALDVVLVVAFALSAILIALRTVREAGPLKV